VAAACALLPEERRSLGEPPVQRARQFAVFELDNSLCSLEMARTYCALNQQNPALMLPHSISSTDHMLKGKVSFLRAKWSQEMNSAECESITRSYAQAAALFSNPGKAFFAMASFAD
jgi:hypothetical protein